MTGNQGIVRPADPPWSAEGTLMRTLRFLLAAIVAFALCDGYRPDLCSGSPKEETADRQAWELVQDYRDLPDSDKLGLEGERIRERLQMLVMLKRSKRIQLSSRAQDAIERVFAEHGLRQLVEEIRTRDKKHWAADPDWLRGVLKLIEKPPSERPREEPKAEAGKPDTALIQVRFFGPAGAKIRLFGAEDKTAQEIPCRLTFDRPGKHRLKLTDIPDRPGLVLYPTIELFAGTARTAEYLEHNAIPVAFTTDDLELAAADGLATRVVALSEEPDDSPTSARGDAETIETARKKGTLLLILRLGSIDLEGRRPGGEPGAK
jgi:hypothetical protein